MPPSGRVNSAAVTVLCSLRDPRAGGVPQPSARRIQAALGFASVAEAIIVVWWRQGELDRSDFPGQLHLGREPVWLAASKI